MRPDIAGRYRWPSMTDFWKKLQRLIQKIVFILFKIWTKFINHDSCTKFIFRNADYLSRGKFGYFWTINDILVQIDIFYQNKWSGQTLVNPT